MSGLWVSGVKAAWRNFVFGLIFFLFTCLLEASGVLYRQQFPPGQLSMKFTKRDEKGPVLYFGSGAAEGD